MSLFGPDVLDRSMTRAVYHRQRQLAHSGERDAALLRPSWPAEAARELAAAKRLRAELAAPPDLVEMARQQRLHRLRAALHLHVQAVQYRRDARAIARSVRAA